MIERGVIERRESSNQRSFETHRSRQQVARQHAPRALLAAHVKRAGDVVDHNPQFALSLDDLLDDRVRHFGSSSATRAMAARTDMIFAARSEPSAIVPIGFSLTADG